MKQIDQALQKIELGKKAFDEAEQILAELLQGDAVPSVIEQEPVNDPIEDRMDQAGIEFEDKTPPRTDLVCYLCDSKVYDNRPQKKSGQYKETSPDFVCANNTDCSGMKQGQYGMLRKSWWLNSKDLPQEWIKTVVPPTEDTVVIEDKSEDQKDLPFQ
jgi:hypothetical protein